MKILVTGFRELIGADAVARQNRGENEFRANAIERCREPAGPVAIFRRDASGCEVKVITTFST